MGSAFLHAICEQAARNPDRVAFANSRGESITYAQLEEGSNDLAWEINTRWDVAAKVPVVVYGHKSPLMLVAFLACVKSGHAYVPVDIVYPRDRVASIIDQLGETAAIDTTGQLLDVLEGDAPCPVHDIREFAGASGHAHAGEGELPGVGQDDLFYLLFTSGSTGTPKGVAVSAECVDGFYRWLSSCEYAGGGRRVWFNRSPFTFDVSLTDMAGGLTRGDTCFALAEEDEAGLARAFEALRSCNPTDWVSTPSFLEMCLADESFDAAMLPGLERMLLAGEVLRPETVSLVRNRFPKVRVFNGYGPTESTDLVSLCEITDDMLASGRALPIGYAKEGSRLVVLNPETLAEVPDGQPGELFVIGDTVAHGYWGRDDLTQAAFRACPGHLAGGMRTYRTGDEVVREPDGLYYYHGRLDSQIKLHGYRIELGDIESSLCALDDVLTACVIPVVRNGSISHLTAFVVPADTAAERGFQLTRAIKVKLADMIPGYMIPRSIKYLDEMPLNPSGKVDRKALAAR